MPELEADENKIEIVVQEGKTILECLREGLEISVKNWCKVNVISKDRTYKIVPEILIEAISRYSIFNDDEKKG